MNRHQGNPRIQLVGKVDQILRVVEQRLDQHPEQPNQNGHLHNQRPQAAYRADAAFPVQLHRFLRYALPVAGVPFLDLPHPRLQPGHRPHLPHLPHRQRDGYHPHQHRERNDGYPHLRQAQHIQHQQGVEHRPDDDLVPEEDEYGEKFHLESSCVLADGLTRRTVAGAAPVLPGVIAPFNAQPG